MQVLSHCILTLCCMNFLNMDSKFTTKSYLYETFLYGFMLHIDPQSWPFLLILVICAWKRRSFVIQLGLMVAFAFGVLPIVSGEGVNVYLTNVSNILFLKDTRPNIGLYYYIIVELFLEHTSFFVFGYLAF